MQISECNLHWHVSPMHPSISLIDVAANDADNDSLTDLYLVRCSMKYVALALAHPIQDFLTFEPYCDDATMLPKIDDALNALICPFEHQLHGNDFEVLNQALGTHLHPSTFSNGSKLDNFQLKWFQNPKMRNESKVTYNDFSIFKHGESITSSMHIAFNAQRIGLFQIKPFVCDLYQFSNDT